MTDRLEMRLRAELQSLRPTTADVDTGRLVAAGRRRALRRTTARAVTLSAVACALVAAGLAVMARTAVHDAVDIGPANRGVSPADGRSQSPEDARRDGVVPEVAALPLPVRTERITAVDTDQGTWATSRLGDAAEPYTDGNCAIGDPDGTYGVDYVCAAEYGELLLLDKAGRIERAYPTPGLPPDWVHVTDDYVYAGHVGDGALPDGSLVRVDRETLEATVVVMVAPDPDRAEGLPWPEAWIVPTPAVADELRSLVTVGEHGTGTRVTSGIGVVTVDLPAVDAALDGMAG